MRKAGGKGTRADLEASQLEGVVFLFSHTLSLLGRGAQHVGEPVDRGRRDRNMCPPYFLHTLSVTEAKEVFLSSVPSLLDRKQLS